MEDSANSPEGLFEPVDVDRVADAVVHQIEELIIAGVLRPGGKLPPERELSERLGVSRPKLREAIHILEQRGLIRVRRNEGAFVETLTTPLLSPAMMALFGRHRSAFSDFLEYRREQEAFAAHLAAQRATAGDHRALERAVADMESLHAGEVTETELEFDIAFHLAVVEAAHNAILLHAMRPVYEIMAQGVFHSRDLIYHRSGARERLLDQHRAIAEAVIARDPHRAAEASDAHLDYIESAFRSAEHEERRTRVARKRLLAAERPQVLALRRR